MNIKFRLVNEKEIIILNEEPLKNQGTVSKEIGRIFTPSSSSNNITNAIQVCGFEEAFDLWGCAMYARPLTEDEQVLKNLGNHNTKMKQCKDIQLLFMPGSTHHVQKGDILKDCGRCYNIPCSCDNKIPEETFEKFNVEKNVTHLFEQWKTNPFTIKREGELKIEYEKKQ